MAWGLTPTYGALSQRGTAQGLTPAVRTWLVGERERQVFRERSMADTVDVPSHEDFAERFGISAAHVHQTSGMAARLKHDGSFQPVAPEMLFQIVAVVA